MQGPKLLSAAGRLVLLFLSPWTSVWPAADLLPVDASQLPDKAEVMAWHVRKDAGGPTFAGSPSWQDYMLQLQEGFARAGLVDVFTDDFAYTRWYTADDPAANQWSLYIGGEAVPVASYWAYSGSTGPDGVTAPLLMYDKSLPREALQGKIVVFKVQGLSEPLPAMFQAAGYEFATDAETLGSNALLAANQWYQSNYVTRFGRLDSIIKGSGAAGALVLLDMGSGRAAGLYTFPLLKPGLVGVPGLYLDRVAGEKVVAAAAKGQDATLRLIASEEPAKAYFYAGFLPGRNYGTAQDEYVLLVTHADGPNLTQDNGGFGILSVIQYFAGVPKESRPRTLLVMIDSQHFMPNRHMTDWYALHPEIVKKVVATIGIEHLGQYEYMEQGAEFVKSGLPETTIVFAQDNDRLVNGAIAGIKAFEVPRAMVQSPPRGGQGNWAGMSDIAVKKNLPGYGITTNMSAYWSTRAGISSFDPALFVRQVGLATYLTAVLMTLSTDELALPVAAKAKQ